MNKHGLTKRKILVTGADGFIGSHLTEALVRQGHSVRSFVYYNSFNSWGWLDQSPPEVKKKLDIFSGDVRDPHGVWKAMQGCDTVFHLAALIGIPYSYHSPDTYIDTNVKGTLNVVQAAKELRVQKVVHTSTSEVYGSAQRVPIDETHPLSGQSPYSASKIGADQIALSFHLSFGTPVAIARPFNTYGPRQSARAVIPAIITQLASGTKKIKLGDVTPTRDFSFVQDTVNGLIAIAGSKKTVGEVVNLGSGFEISIEDTAKSIAKIMGRKLSVESSRERQRPEKSEVRRLWADNQKARRLTGWEPEYAGMQGFERGLKETVAWFSRNENLARYKADRWNM